MDSCDMLSGLSCLIKDWHSEATRCTCAALWFWIVATCWGLGWDTIDSSSKTNPNLFGWNFPNSSTSQLFLYFQTTLAMMLQSWGPSWVRDSRLLMALPIVWLQSDDSICLISTYKEDETTIDIFNSVQYKENGLKYIPDLFKSY